MIREAIGQQLDHDPNFRWRGEAVTRIENLSDIAFALALGMIISSGSPPETVGGLRNFLFFIVPTAAAFAIILQIWSIHYTFFRRYGVADMKIIFLNAVLIFLVLYLAYPLRFTFDSLFAWVFTEATRDSSYRLLAEVGVKSPREAGEVIAVFSLFFGAVFALYALMYRHVLRRRDILALNATETLTTQATHAGLWAAALIALLVAPVAAFTAVGPWAGLLLPLQRPAKMLAGNWVRRGAAADEPN